MSSGGTTHLVRRWHGCIRRSRCQCLDDRVWQTQPHRVQDALEVISAQVAASATIKVPVWGGTYDDAGTMGRLEAMS